MKIKIASKEREYDGSIVEKAVTPFGTSAHIPFSKEHTGKFVNVIVPTEPKYAWVLTAEEKKTIVRVCKALLSGRKETKEAFYYHEAVNNLSKNKIELDDLNKVYVLLEEGGKIVLAKRMKNAYNL